MEQSEENVHTVTKPYQMICRAARRRTLSRQSKYQIASPVYCTGSEIRSQTGYNELTVVVGEGTSQIHLTIYHTRSGLQ